MDRDPPAPTNVWEARAYEITGYGGTARPTRFARGCPSSLTLLDVA
jgi:hypothetical protein